MATQIKDIIDKFLNKKQKEIFLKNNIRDVVYKILNNEHNLSNYVSFGSIYKNKLILYTNSSVVAYKIKLIKDKILKEEVIKKSKIKDILIKIKDGRKQ